MCKIMQEHTNICKNHDLSYLLFDVSINPFNHLFTQKRIFVLIKILGRTSVLVFSRQGYGINCSLKLLTCAIPKSEGFVVDNKFI